MVGVDIGALLIRVMIGVIMVAHGWNHAFGGGKLPGTARWFESIGIRPGWAHARMATLTELGSGFLLLLGLFTPVAAAGVVGTMGVALVANHLKNGFFIFRPGEGYEYVLFLVVTSLALAAIGGGRGSVDNAIGLSVTGWWGLVIALAAGGGGAALLLISSWRPNAVERS